MSAIKKGDAVKQNIFVIHGTVVKLGVNEDTGELKYHVEYEDNNGETQSRWFEAGDIVSDKEGAE